MTIEQTTNTPRVLNKRNIKGQTPAGAIYCGRPSKWGNPFEIGRDGNRREVIAKHEQWLATQPQLMAQIESLRGKDLICWCAPKACHCDTLIRLANGPRCETV